MNESGPSVPDCWPPSQPPSALAPVPLFPLPNVFLFPGTLMPLHIFEPRYRQMIEDSLDGPGRLVVAAVLEEFHDELSGAPPVYPVAGLGEIARHERLPDGRFVIMLFGLARVKIRELPSDRPYRQVEAAPLQEVPPADLEAERLRPKLLRAVLQRTPELLNLPDEMPLGHLADLLLLRMALPQSAMQDLYSRLSIVDRARRALAEHSRRPLPPPEPPG